MLRELHLRHFGPFTEVTWELRPGWTVLTGETGTGKSLLVEALQCIAGARVQSRWFSPRHPWAEVEAVFDVPRHPEILRPLRAEGLLDEDDETTLVVRRRIHRDGRHQIWLQGRRSTLKSLQTITRALLDICDQWGVPRMLKSDVQRAWLDVYGDLLDAVAEVRRLARQIHRLAHTLRGMEDPATVRQRLKGMRQEWKELIAADLREGEEEELNQQFQLLSQSMRIQETVDRLLRDFQEGDEVTFMEQVRAWQRSLEDLKTVAPDLEGYITTMEEWVATVQALVYDLVQLRERAQWDPVAWQKVEARFSLLEHLKRKYRMTYDQLLAYRDRLAWEIEQLERQLLEKEQVRQRIDDLYRTYREQAAVLHHRRQDAARRLAEAATEQVRKLAMRDAAIQVMVTSVELPETWSPDVRVSETGADRVAFLFRSHERMPWLPLAQVASGGELARAVLAIKAVVGRPAWSRTVVFDEIDMGVGGEALEAVGEMLRTIAAFDQVITVTHWPQLAAMADDHWQVTKTVEGEAPVLNLRPLTPAERVQEIVRMLGGQSVAPTVRAHAEALLERFRKTS